MNGMLRLETIVMQITKLSELAFDADNQGIFCPLILPDEADKTPDELTYHGKGGGRTSRNKQYRKMSKKCEVA